MNPDISVVLDAELRPHAAGLSAEDRCKLADLHDRWANQLRLSVTIEKRLRSAQYAKQIIHLQEPASPEN